ncbi:MAG: purine-binding chemotaxis protein CheW [Oscillibacter sp.]|jgi:purine-binding chemotaxis protein CheW|uniref:chemotaxis protein CheW n=1 Tax=uncultured Oscillibacter sp. TaxID=876091 RepID=UPI00216F6424|nr:chemotaxis protein CheW [uncultured Oscillibacter sp.]MCI8801725.1 purine-binding chemotaxis protein CheW [Oscillibacter sp.]
MKAVQEEALFQISSEYDETAPQEEEVIESRKHLIFVTDNLKLGLDAEYVVEILNHHTVTYLPMMPDYIRGIFNMRGQIIPIMDIRQRLGKFPLEDGESLLVVLNYNETQIGILVDSVESMIDIPKDSIVPIPSRSAQKLVSGMCTLPDGSGTMLVLDCEQLLEP